MKTFDYVTVTMAILWTCLQRTKAEVNAKKDEGKDEKIKERNSTPEMFSPSIPVDVNWLKRYC